MFGVGKGQKSARGSSPARGAGWLARKASMSGKCRHSTPSRRPSACACSAAPTCSSSIVTSVSVSGPCADSQRSARRAIVVVRPDQYVAHVLPLAATDELAAFFGAFMQSRGPAAA